MSRPKPYYRAGGVTLYHGDCLTLLPRLRLRCDLVLTDPPYAFRHVSAAGFGRRELYDSALDDNLCTGDVASLAPALLAGRRAAIFHSRDQIAPLSSLLAERYDRYDLHIWWKTDAPPFTGGTWLSDLEYIALGYDLPVGIARGPRADRSKCYASPTCKPAPGKNHPTAKPLPLMTKYLRAFRPGLVLDPFCGGGSVLVAARSLGIRAVGIEREERWCAAAARWLETGQPTDWRVTMGLRPAPRTQGAAA